MFCKNCGSQMAEEDRFCGTCGQTRKDDQKSIPHNIPVINGGEIMNFVKIYFTKPLSFFSEFKDKDLVKPSIILLIVLTVFYGLINILYNSILISSIFSMLKKIPKFLAKVGIISAQEVALARSQILMSDEMLNFKSKIYALVDNKEIFLKGAGQLLAIIVLTAVILSILNVIILKNKIKTKDIIFIATVSYIPLVLSAVLASLGTLISITFGIFIFVSGYVLSFITLFSGIKQLSGDTNDKVFILIIALFILVSAILSLCISRYLVSSFMEIQNAIENIIDYTDYIFY